VHYSLVDGGAITSPANAVFDGVSDWVAENIGVPPDIEVVMDAGSVAEGRDPQLERGVTEALRMVEEAGITTVTTPRFPIRSRRPER
jgi:tricorn protease